MPQSFNQDRVNHNGNQQPMMQENMMQQPMMQQPTMQQPMMQQPMMQQPMMQQPMMQQPMMQQPGMYPGMGQPSMQQPFIPSYMDEMDEMDERDMEYLKKMYPELNQKIQKHIDSECNRMDYDGSPMYDEYPDQESIEQMIDRVYERTVDEMPEVLEETDMERQRIPRYRLVRSLVGALLLSELFGRRQRYRRRYPYYQNSYYQYPYYQYPYYQYPYPYY